MRYIIEETMSTTYFHAVEADSLEEARKKFHDDNGVNYNIRDPFYGDDTYYEFYTEEEWGL